MSKVRIVDLSVPVEPDKTGIMNAPKVNHIPHEDSLLVMSRIFGCTAEDLPQGKGWTVDKLTLGNHDGTHVDAPWH